MSSRIAAARVETGDSLPVFERLAPAPAAGILAAHIDDHTGPGDVVADLAGRGGWVARAALDRQRRAVSIESNPLTRMLAEVVLRPPDVRHLDAAFQGMSASPRGQSSLKVSMGDLFATRCATCGRTLVADEVTWTDEGGSGTFRPTTRHYRCTVCRDQRGGSELRHGPLEPDDVERALDDAEVAIARSWARDRFPIVEGAPDLVDELLDLHTPRQLIALTAIMERIEADLRAAPVLAALRLALLHAVLPSSRLATAGGRGGSLHIASGHVKLPTVQQWRERNPWVAFEEGFRTVRGFVQRLEGGALGPLQARLGEDLRALGEGAATAVVAVASASAVRALGSGAGDAFGRSGPAAPKVRLVLGQPPVRPSLDRLAAAYHGTAWALGREAASLLPIDALADSSLRAPWSWQAVALSRSLAAVEPAMARDGRVVQVVDGGPEALAAVAIGGASAGYRVVVARQSDPDDAGAGVVELIPPGAAMPPGPRTRANVALPAVPGGPGDPDVVPSRGLFAPPERFDQRPFSAAEAARVVTEAAVETLRARGEPARMERLFGEILVGLDRSGQLRRLASGSRTAAGTGNTAPSSSSSGRDDDAMTSTTGPDGDASTSSGGLAGDASTPASGRAGDPSPATDGESRGEATTPPPGDAARATPADRRSPADAEASADPVDRLLALIRDELASPRQRRLAEIEPGRWWLADEADRAAAAPPLADRVEWAVFSLLSTAGPLTETAFYERIATMFTGHDLPDETLVRACLDSYRSPAGAPDHVVTSDDLLRRSHEHTELLAALTDAGHRLGMRVWLAEREQARRLAGGHLGDLLEDRERHAYLGSIGRAVDALAEVDAIWYIRNKVALLFEVEWTAMLGEPLLRRHARIEPDDRLIRFLVIAPERTDLVRHKLDRSPLLRSALETGGWTIIKWDHLRTWLEAERPELADLEPLIGLDPVVERAGEQMPLFGG